MNEFNFGPNSEQRLVGVHPGLAKVVRRALPADFAPIVTAMRAAAAELGIPVVHGADWGWDHPHHELDRKVYP